MLLCLQPEQNPQPQERIQIGLFSFSSQVQNDCVVGQPSGYSTLSIFINILKTQKTIYFFPIKKFFNGNIDNLPGCVSFRYIGK